MSLKTQNIKAIGLGLSAFLIYAVADSILKETTKFYETGFSGLIVASLHFLLLLVILPFIGGFGGLLRPVFPVLLGLRGLFATACWIFFILGMQYNDLAVNYSVLLSASIWVALFSVLFLKSRLGIFRWTAILIGFAGVLIVLQPTPQSFAITSLIPLISALSFAACQMITRFIGAEEKQTTILFYTALINIFGAILFVLVTGGWQELSLAHLPVFALSAFCYLIGNLLAVKAFSMGETSAVTPTQYSQIIWGALIGFFFFAEIPTLWTIIGAGLIVLSGLIMIYRESFTTKITKGTKI